MLTREARVPLENMRDRQSLAMLGGGAAGGNVGAKIRQGSLGSVTLNISSI
jgi:hypothetical protein